MREFHLKRMLDEGKSEPGKMLICVTLNLDHDNRDDIHNGRILGCHLEIYLGNFIFIFSSVCKESSKDAFFIPEVEV